MNLDAVAIVRDFYASWNPDHLDPAVEWRMAAGFPNGGIYRGVAGVFEDWWPKHAATFSEWKAAPEQFVGEGDLVVVLGRYSGRALSTGQAIDVPFAHIWRTKDGRITRFDQLCDTLVIDRLMSSN